MLDEEPAVAMLRAFLHVQVMTCVLRKHLRYTVYNSAVRYNCDKPKSVRVFVRLSMGDF